MRQLRLLMLTGIILAVCYAVPHAVERVAPNLLITTTAPIAPPTPDTVAQTQLAHSIAGAFKAVQGIVATGARGIVHNGLAVTATSVVSAIQSLSPTHQSISRPSSTAGPKTTGSPTGTPVAVKPTAVPTSAPAHSPTTVPTASGVADQVAKKLAVRVGTTLYVGNTGGDGVFLRKTPARSARLRAWADKTPMVVVGPDSPGIGDSWTWKHVRAPDGQIGWIPVQYLTAQS